MKYWQRLSPEQAQAVYMVSSEIAHDPRNQFYFYLSRPEFEGNWSPDGDAPIVFAAFTVHPTLDYLTIFQFGTIDPELIEGMKKDHESFLDSTDHHLLLNKLEMIELIEILSVQANRFNEVAASNQTFKRLEGDAVPKLKGFADLGDPSTIQYYLQLPNSLLGSEKLDQLNLLLFDLGGSLRPLRFDIYQIPTNYSQIILNEFDLMDYSQAKLILSRSGIVELIRILEAQTARL